ncbi:cysteine-rich CWC family protein [Reinekea blandensis]|uniref:cysteine-rich CWC family protein n=1 Tax=Reinekea blandensis TaxID=374838 RepID=UPI000A003EB2|nr:cysteine-rich CWC family protein [Reinekea blandensis]
MTQQQCPLCEQPNECTGDTQCWCMSVTISETQRQKIPEADLNARCLCRQCAEVTPEALSKAEQLTCDKE